MDVLKNLFALMRMFRALSRGKVIALKILVNLNETGFVVAQTFPEFGADRFPTKFLAGGFPVISGKKGVVAIIARRDDNRLELSLCSHGIRNVNHFRRFELPQAVSYFNEVQRDLDRIGLKRRAFAGRIIRLAAHL